MLRVALVGLPGSGKSTVGRQLARRLDIPFSDSDHVIERQIGCSIRDFFAREGEAAFRIIEENTIDQMTSGAAGVFSTGGGAVINENTRKRLHERCSVVYLHSSPDEVYRRLRHDTNRPLLQTADPQARLREMYDARDPLYRNISHFTIETGRPSVPTLVNMIVMQLELAGLA